MQDIGYVSVRAGTCLRESIGEAGEKRVIALNVSEYTVQPNVYTAP